MTRTMYDSTAPSAIPATAQLVAGYIDGIYAWTDAAWARFPNAVQVRIACFAHTNAGQVLDVETGCAAPIEAPGWAQRRRAAGVEPTVYVNRANWAAVRQAFQQQGVAEPCYWLATLDGSQPWAPGVFAIQTTNAAHAGGPYDISVVADHWPGVDTPGGGEDDMWTDAEKKKVLDFIIWTETTLAGQDPNNPGILQRIQKIEAALKSA